MKVHFDVRIHVTSVIAVVAFVAALPGLAFAGADYRDICYGAAVASGCIFGAALGIETLIEEDEDED